MVEIDDYLSSFTATIELRDAGGAVSETWFLDLREHGFSGNIEEFLSDLRSVTMDSPTSIDTVLTTTEHTDDEFGFEIRMCDLRVRTTGVDRGALEALLLESAEPSVLGFGDDLDDSILDVDSAAARAAEPVFSTDLPPVGDAPGTEPPWTFRFEDESAGFDITILDVLGLVVHRRGLGPISKEKNRIP